MNKIVTISREFGSGGREIGKRLADELGYAYYDKEIIKIITEQTGMTEEYITNISEKGIYPYSFHFAKSFTAYSKVQNNQTTILVAETDKELKHKIMQVDKNRKKYHEIISNIKWGDKENYHLCINTTEL